MQPGSDAPTSVTASLPEAVTRTIRHEVGDLLQTIYSTVALLQRRLPAEMEMERRLVANLRARAEMCRHLLDTVHDFVCPLSLSYTSVDLAELAARLTASAAARFPHLEVRAEAAGPVPVQADAQRLADAGSLLVLYACGRAGNRVTVRSDPGPSAGEAQWTITDDGPPVRPEEWNQVQGAFAVLKEGHLQLGLAPASKIVLMHGGRINGTTLPGGGQQLTIVLPREPGPEASRP
jgi:signal transduction histidine kinase